jgi:hypothetical protein
MLIILVLHQPIIPNYIMHSSLRKSLFLLIAATLFTSCFTRTLYVRKDPLNRKVDFSKGEWLLSNVDGPGSEEEKMENLANEKLKKLLGNRLHFIDNSRNKFMLPNTLPDILPPSTLKELYKATGLNYLIHITAKPFIKLKGIDPDTGYPPTQTEVRVTIIIYDLEKGKNNYQQTVYATLDYTQNPDGTWFSRIEDGIYVPALKKALKKLAQNSSAN